VTSTAAPGPRVCVGAWLTHGPWDAYVMCYYEFCRSMSHYLKVSWIGTGHGGPWKGLGGVIFVLEMTDVA
jgi:hypothetical protein